MTELYRDDRGEKPEVEYEPAEFPILTEENLECCKKTELEKSRRGRWSCDRDGAGGRRRGGEEDN